MHGIGRQATHGAGQSRRLTRRWAFAGLLALPALALGQAELPAPLGVRPAHLGAFSTGVANHQAIDWLIWAPGIDDGYVPQGLAWGDGALYLSSYRSTDPKVDRGPCRLFRIDPDSGSTLGQFDLPADCGHAGGVAWLGQGTLVVADTRRLYRIDVQRAFAQTGRVDAVTGTLALGGELRGSFADFDGRALFIGRYDKDAARSRGHWLPLSLFDTHQGATVDERHAQHTRALPPLAQGAAFASDGTLWVSSSSSQFGRVTRLPDAGDAAAVFEWPIGSEDIAFDDAGRLWGVSEAGSLRWNQWRERFPLLFRIDTSRLR